MAGAASTDSAADAAFGAPARSGVPAGAIRVDDTRLAEWTTTEFAPPKGITAWQGGVLVTEDAGKDQQVAWLLGAAIDGYIDLDDSDPKAIVIRDKPHPVDATTGLLDVAFAGRDQIELGSYDSAFSAMWKSLSSLQKNWFRASGFADFAAERRVGIARLLGALGVVAADALILVSAYFTYAHGLPGVIGIGLGALLGGVSIALLVRSWELHVRTPAGSAMWLRVASFRRFLHESEAEHVRQAAERGVLREYTAWAVALDEVDHWRAVVSEAGLPPTTTGLSMALVAGSLASTVSATSTAPSSSGGGGVGGGGGGGGGGSW